jgi:hypothetical protein
MPTSIDKGSGSGLFKASRIYSSERNTGLLELDKLGSVVEIFEEGG